MHEFNAQFNYLMANSGIVNKAALLAYYRRALPNDLRQAVAMSYPLPNTLKEWIHRTAEVHNAREKDKALLGYTNTHKPWFSNSQHCAKQRKYDKIE